MVYDPIPSDLLHVNGFYSTKDKKQFILITLRINKRCSKLFVGFSIMASSIASASLLITSVQDMVRKEIFSDELSLNSGVYIDFMRFFDVGKH